MCASVADHYEGQSVFITGCTGLLGKVFLEKILYSCPGLEKVYVLIREKYNMTPQQRMMKILDVAAFSRLKAEKPNAIEKIVPIFGDLSEQQLGIKEDDAEMLIENVSTVFHLAANTKFNETLDVYYSHNVMGTTRILDLCHRMKHIKTFLYVSTAFSNGEHKVIEEKIYPTPYTLDEIKSLILSGVTEEQAKTLTGQKPNVYTLSKVISEKVVVENHGRIPTVIVRPAIVSCSKAEPFAGWLDSWLGASSLIGTVARGLNRVILSDHSNILNLIPVDYVSNLIIVAAANCKSSDEISVYNSTSNEDNPLTYKLCTDIVVAESIKIKCYNSFKPSLHFTRYRWVVTLYTLVFQIIPAFVMDTLLFIRRKNTRYMKLCKIMIAAREALESFTTRTWTIKAEKTKALFDSLSSSDQTLFPFNHQDIDWAEYLPNYLMGIEQYLWKT